MKPRAVAKELAAAAFEAHLDLRATARGLGDLAAVLAGQPDLAGILGHPALKAADLKILLREAAPGLDELGLACVEGLAQARGLRSLGRVASETLKLADLKDGVVEARVESARTLSPIERDDLSKSLAAALGGKIRIVEELVPGLIGGVRIEAEGKVFEGSVRGQLDAIRKELRAA